jgi:hypothetical protein
VVILAEYASGKRNKNAAQNYAVLLKITRTEKQGVKG